MAYQAGLQKFSSDVYGQVVQQQSETLQNTVFAPISIYIALMMTMLGAGGRTLNECKKAVHIQEDENMSQNFGSTLLTKITKSNHVTLANRVFLMKKVNILDPFRKDLQEAYSAEAEEFGTELSLEEKQTKINQWVSEKTNSHISEIISPSGLSEDDVLVLVNAICFKDAWKDEFHLHDTKDDTFHSLNGEQLTVNMMYIENWQFPYTNLDNFSAEAAKIPFSDPAWEMLVLLPKENNGLPNLLKRLPNSEDLKTILETPFESKTLDLKLPRFNFSKQPPLDWKQMLKALGVESLFSKDADLSKISSTTSLSLSAMEHKAMLPINEYGAATESPKPCEGFGCGRHYSLVYTTSHNFHVNHPFFMALVYNSSTPVFMGHVVAP